MDFKKLFMLILSVLFFSSSCSTLVEADGPKCQVCGEGVKLEDGRGTLVETECGHLFHPYCISYFKYYSNSRCYICNSKITDDWKSKNLPDTKEPEKCRICFCYCNAEDVKHECGCFFHNYCIVQRLRGGHTKCPICKLEITNDWKSKNLPDALTKEEPPEPNSMCSICKKDFQNYPNFIKSECGCFFHSECVGDWFGKERKRWCPSCYCDVKVVPLLAAVKIDLPKDAECCICLSEIKENQAYTRAHARHFFHTDCINRWGFKDKGCPLCKYGSTKSPNMNVQLVVFE